MGNTPGPAYAQDYDNRVEPTVLADTGYDTYLWPHSKTPRKDALYQRLRVLGWRFNQTTGEFVTPEAQTFQAKGRLSHEADLSRAWIQPPADGTTDDRGLHILPEPLLELTWINEEWHITARRTNG